MDYSALLDAYTAKTTTGKEKFTDDERVSFVQRRFNAMAEVKVDIRNVWQGTQYLEYCNDWEWIVRGDDFNGVVRFPTLRDVRKSLVDVYMQDPPDVVLKAKKESEKHLAIGKKAYLEELRESIHEKKVKRQVIDDMFFYGSGFRRVGYCEHMEKYDMMTSRVDPRDVFIDESAVELHGKGGKGGARDAIIRSKMPMSTFMKMAKDEEWDVAGITAKNYMDASSNDFLATNNKEINEKSMVYGVEMYEYFNSEEDLYIITVGNKCIFEDTLTNAFGDCCIPFVQYQFEPRNDSVWGTNLAQLIAPHIYLRDTLINLEIMNLKLTLQPVIAVSGEFGFNKKLHQIQPGAVWQPSGVLNGKVADNITPLTFGNPNTQVYNMLNVISSEMSVTSRSELRNLEYMKNKTATEVMNTNKSMNAHNETIENINEIESEAVLFTIMVNMMSKFMSYKDEEEKRNVTIKGYRVMKKDGEDPEFEKSSGYEDTFELSQEMIDVPVEICVYDKRSQVAKNNEKVGRLMQVLALYGNLIQLDPKLAQQVNLLGHMEQLDEYIGLDPERSFNKEYGGVDDPYQVIKEDILLGHKVEMDMTESRADSQARLKYFTALMPKVADKPENVKQALQDYILQIMTNIFSPKAKVMQNQAPLPEEAMQQIAGPAQQQTPIPQPDKGMMMAGQYNNIL